MTSNKLIWDKLKTPPEDALKPITAGRLKGKTDISPQWRLEALTEVFGPCGIGWKYTIDRLWNEPYTDGQIACFANISLYFKHDNEWSEPIPANGGSMFVSQESRGLHVSDECYKMAITDAIGTAAKCIGVASDVYRGYSDSKYVKPSNELPWLNAGTKEWDNVVKYFIENPNPQWSKVFEKFKVSKENQQKIEKQALEILNK